MQTTIPKERICLRHTPVIQAAALQVHNQQVGSPGLAVGSGDLLRCRTASFRRSFDPDLDLRLHIQKAALLDNLFYA